MIDDTAKDVVSSPDKFEAFLNTQSKIDRYLAVNTLLIYNQYHNATQLKDFDDWGKEKVSIKKEMRSIRILEPVEYSKKDGTTGISYNVKRVFDVTQTNGTKTPSPTINKDPRNLIKVMLDSSPVNVESSDNLPYTNGAAYYDNDRQTIYVKRNVGDSVLVLQSVAQELGQAQLSINSERYSRNESAFSAMCIGYMLCKKYGVDTQNFAINRIPDSLKNGDVKEIRAELSKTRNAMSEIHSRINDELYKQKQARNKEYER